MTVQPRISVIVPVYQAELYLSACIDSILGQTYTNFELLLIDDGSSDQSGKVCDQYALKDSRIRVFHRENHGVSAARNFGLQNITGEYVLFVDSDDIINPVYIEGLYQAFPKECPNGISLCRIQYLIDGCRNDKAENLCSFSKESDSLYDMYIRPLISGEIQGSSCRVLYPVQLLKNCNIQFSPCKIAEDLLFFTEVISHVDRITFSPESLYIYRQEKGSSSHRNYIMNYLPDRCIYIRELNRILKSCPISQEQYQELMAFSFQFYRMLLYMNATASGNAKQELAAIDSSIFGTVKIPDPLKKLFHRNLSKKHRVLSYLTEHRCFTIIKLIRSMKKFYR